MTNFPAQESPYGNMVVGGPGKAPGKLAQLWQKLWAQYRWFLVTGAGVVVVAIVGTVVLLSLHHNRPIATAPTSSSASQGAANTNTGNTQTNTSTTPTPITKPEPKKDTKTTPAPSSGNTTGGSGTGGTGGTSSGGGTGGITVSWPNETNTGVPSGVSLHSCATTITVAGTYDACQFNGDLLIRANNVHVTRSLINGQVDAQSGDPGQQTGLVISDSTIDCGCQSVDDTHTPVAIGDSNYTLLRVNILNAGHGASVRFNVVIQDSYIHGLGGNTDAHKDGIYVGDGTNVTIKHNNIECNDGPKAGCTSAIGILTDFSDVTYFTIDNNLLNTNGAYCFYGSGGPSKSYGSNHITFTNNHFGRKYNQQCGFYGPVTYFDTNQPGMVWSGNVWDDTGASVPAVY
jgi:hypothetical protein